MLYLIMPDRFANGNQNDSDATTKKIQSRFTRRKTRRRHSRDNKNLDYISSLGATAIWSTPLCEDNDKAYSYHYAQSDVYKIDPVTEQMLITCVWPLRCIKDMKLVMDYVVNHWGRTLDDERFTNTGLDSSI
jgi:glycosidase